MLQSMLQSLIDEFDVKRPNGHNQEVWLSSLNTMKATVARASARK